jgi:SprT protein
MQRAEAIQKVIRRISEVYAIAERAYRRSFVFPEVTFDVRGKAAGRAYFYQNRIALNLRMLLENGQGFIDDTPGHEAAHLISFKVYGVYTKPHGREWQSVMRVIGQAPNRTHSFQTQGFAYFCSCREHTLSTRMHNSIQRQLQTRICRYCRQVIKWAKLHEKNLVTV